MDDHAGDSDDAGDVGGADGSDTDEEDDTGGKDDTGEEPDIDGEDDADNEDGTGDGAGDDEDASDESDDDDVTTADETETSTTDTAGDGDDDSDVDEIDADDGGDEDADVDEEDGDTGTEGETDDEPESDAANESATGIEAPETDEEMPLADHIEEMMRRLGIVFLVGGLALILAFPSASELINYFWSYHIPEPNVNRPRLYGPLELVLTRIKVAGLAGVFFGLPVFVYQTYRFMRPGLYRKERRYYLAAVPTSLILGGIGILFAHFLVLPAIFSYFTTYTSDAATIAFGLKETFNLIVVMMSFMAIVFQIPLFIMLAIMMNLVTRQWLEDKRLIFWGTFLGIAFLFSPDPTGMAPIIVTLTMIALYEGTLALLRWTGN
ncbi:preprotein translocase subunit TatC [haloarchaeon 3A1-DGR]|nr:preprotein translocase subunit TatC [haloarchaeon 3A1-DGR]